MKKFFLMVAMVFATSMCAFAEDNSASKAEIFEKYDMKVSGKRLSKYLELTSDQIEAVDEIGKELSNDMAFVAFECNEKSRDSVANNAISKNVKYMSYILNKEQYKKYLLVLNATINNRNLK